MTQEPTTRIIRCPQCGKSSRYDASNPDRPFCSSRCKINDVAQWAEESYRIPVQEQDPNEEETNEMLWVKRQGAKDADED